MTSVVYAECRKLAIYAECRYDECHYDVCLGAICSFNLDFVAAESMTNKNIWHSHQGPML